MVSTECQIHARTSSNRHVSSSAYLPVVPRKRCRWPLRRAHLYDGCVHHLKKLSGLALIALVGCGFRATSLAGDGGSSDDADPSGNGSSSTDSANIDAPSPVDAAIASLMDRGLVVRYFMDEAATGTAPASLIDSAPSPLALPITYGQAMFTEANGNRGLRWGASQGTGKIEINLGSTKLQTRLSSARTVTIEIVVQITGAGAATTESQIAGLRGGNPDFMLTAVGSADLRFFKPYGSEGATWIGANAQERMVLHLVFDTTRADQGERLELFRNGVSVAKTTSFAPSMNSTVGLGSGESMLIGNRQNQDRSIAGTIFYAAFYDVALSASEITNNAARLLADDDL